MQHKNQKTHSYLKFLDVKFKYHEYIYVCRKAAYNYVNGNSEYSRNRRNFTIQNPPPIPSGNFRQFTQG